MLISPYSIPIPQYPLYTATLASQEAVPLPYYLNEDKDWSFDKESVLKAIAKARADKIPVKAVSHRIPSSPDAKHALTDTYVFLLST